MVSRFDPFTLLVGSREALERIAERCDRLAVAHSGVVDRGENVIVNVPDPDGIVLRFLHVTADLDRFLGIEMTDDGQMRFYDTPRLSNLAPQV